MAKNLITREEDYSKWYNDLVVKSGKSVRVYDNVVVDNNFKNFAPAGNVVASVPTGTGIMVLATSKVEI